MYAIRSYYVTPKKAANGRANIPGGRMKRSEINAYIRDAERFFADMGFKLPPWASWGPEKWKGMRNNFV